MRYLQVVFLSLTFGIFPFRSTPLYAESAPKPWTAYQYHVTKVTDGDTFVATDGNILFKVRMAGIDAPESSQAFGSVAKQTLQDLLLNRDITLQPVGKGLDLYGRVLGMVYLQSQDVGKVMVEKGLASYYRPRCRDYPQDARQYPFDPTPYVSAETVAKTRKVNMWADARGILPCEFRKRGAK